MKKGQKTDIAKQAKTEFNSLDDFRIYIENYCSKERDSWEINLSYCVFYFPFDLYNVAECIDSVPSAKILINITFSEFREGFCMIKKESNTSSTFNLKECLYEFCFSSSCFSSILIEEVDIFSSIGVSFNKCRIKDVSRFKNFPLEHRFVVKMSKMLFENVVYFEHGDFVTAQLSHLIFQMPVYFKEVKLYPFGGKIDWKCCSSIGLQKVVIEVRLMVEKKKIGGSININKAIFKEGLTCECVNFSELVVGVENSEFYGTLMMNDCSFKHISLSGCNFKKEVTMSGCHFESCFFSNSSFGSLFISKTILNYFSFQYATISDFCSFEDSSIGNLKLNAVYMEKTPLLTSGLKIDKIDREGARILKNEAYKASNMITALDYKVSEMNEFRKELHGWRNWGTMFLLWLNRWSNNYGKDWVLGVGFTLFWWFLFFNLYVLSRELCGVNSDWSGSLYVKEAVSFLWLFDGISVLVDRENVSWWSVIPFLIGKIFIGYGIYQTISAFRKFGK